MGKLGGINLYGSRLIIRAGRYCRVQVDGIAAQHVSQNHDPLSRRTYADRYAEVVGEIIVLKDGASVGYLDAGKRRTQGQETCV